MGWAFVVCAVRDAHLHRGYEPFVHPSYCDGSLKPSGASPLARAIQDPEASFPGLLARWETVWTNRA